MRWLTSILVVVCFATLALFLGRLPLGIETSFAGGSATHWRFLRGPDDSGTLEGAGGARGVLAVLKDASAWKAVAADTFGNVLALAGTGGDFQRRTFDPWGNPLTRDAAGSLRASTLQERRADYDALPLAWASQEVDPDTGLTHYHFREYSPSLGGWLTRDPIGLAGGYLNLRSYLGNRPMDALDVWGEVGNYVQLAGSEGAASFNRDAGEAGAATARPVAEWMQEHPRVMGGAKALGGAVEMVVGAGLIATPEPTMTTKVLGVATCAHGADTFMAGLNQMIDGENKRTLTSRGLESVARAAGADNPELVGELGDAGIGIALMAGSSIAINSATRGSSSVSVLAARKAEPAALRLTAKCPCVDAANTGLEGAAFAQKTFGQTFSSGGKFAGQTIDDVAGSLRSGSMRAGDVPIEYIVRNGNTLMLNTRSLIGSR